MNIKGTRFERLLNTVGKSSQSVLTWDAEFKVGDPVRVRFDQIINLPDYKERYNSGGFDVIMSIDKRGATPYKEDAKGNNIGGLQRPENPSGVLYNLEAGSWEGKDLEIASHIVTRDDFDPVYGMLIPNPSTFNKPTPTESISGSAANEWYKQNQNKVSEISKTNPALYSAIMSTLQFISDKEKSQVSTAQKQPDIVQLERGEPQPPKDPYDGIKIGMEFPMEILNSWTQFGRNRFVGGVWSVATSQFDTPRKVKSFELRDNVWGFTVENSPAILRAEGFLDFYKKQQPQYQKPTTTAKNEVKIGENISRDKLKAWVLSGKNTNINRQGWIQILNTASSIASKLYSLSLQIKKWEDKYIKVQEIGEVDGKQAFSGVIYELNESGTMDELAFSSDGIRSFMKKLGGLYIEKPMRGKVLNSWVAQSRPNITEEKTGPFETDSSEPFAPDAIYTIIDFTDIKGEPAIIVGGVGAFIRAEGLEEFNTNYVTGTTATVKKRGRPKKQAVSPAKPKFTLVVETLRMEDLILKYADAQKIAASSSIKPNGDIVIELDSKLEIKDSMPQDLKELLGGKPAPAPTPAPAPAAKPKQEKTRVKKKEVEDVLKIDIGNIEI